MTEVAEPSLKSIASAARHDLKQSLHVVSLYVQLAQQQIGADHPAATALERALDGLRQQRDQIRRLQQVAEVPRQVRGRAELLEALDRVGERRALRLTGTLGTRWVACPARRLEQLLEHYLAAVAGDATEAVVLELAVDGDGCRLTTSGPARDDLEAGWASSDAAAERYLGARLAEMLGGTLSWAAHDDRTVWTLSLPGATSQA